MSFSGAGGVEGGEQGFCSLGTVAPALISGRPGTLPSGEKRAHSPSRTPSAHSPPPGSSLLVGGVAFQDLPHLRVQGLRLPGLEAEAFWEAGAPVGQVPTGRGGSRAGPGPPPSCPSG